MAFKFIESFNEKRPGLFKIVSGLIVGVLLALVLNVINYLQQVEINSFKKMETFLQILLEYHTAILIGVLVYFYIGYKQRMKQTVLKLQDTIENLEEQVEINASVTIANADDIDRNTERIHAVRSDYNHAIKINVEKIIEKYSQLRDHAQISYFADEFRMRYISTGNLAELQQISSERNWVRKQLVEIWGKQGDRPIKDIDKALEYYYDKNGSFS